MIIIVNIFSNITCHDINIKSNQIKLYYSISLKTIITQKIASQTIHNIFKSESIVAD